LVLAVICIGLLAGVLGAILGIGGGVLVVPALASLLPLWGRNISITQAIAVSQIGVLAVGLSATASYFQQGLVRVRLGYLLLPYMILGGALGSVLGLSLPGRFVATVFAVLLFYSAFTLLNGLSRTEKEHSSSPLVAPAMLFAGIMSGLLGIGGGTVQVPVLNLLAGVPIRQAIATSTFIMGLTAVSNTLVYQAAGVLDAQLAAALAFGILIGGRLGALLQKRIATKQLKLLFSALLIFTATQLLISHWKVV
jgi:uncharacterized protein